METLFLSHHPHEVHLEFAKAIGARIKITPMDGLVKMIKKWPLVSCFYPFICLTYGLFLNVPEEIVLVDGGSSTFIAVALKIKKPSLRIIYLDGDIFLKFSNIFLKRTFLNITDAIISLSEKNRKIAKNYFSGPIEVANPYPKEITYRKVKKKNYGLYVGRLDIVDKRVDRIVKFAIQCPYFERMIIVGDGIFRKKLERIAKKNKKIIYVGKKPDPSEYYNRCKFLIHLADFDPYPCTTMEAAKCGCFPIISKETGTEILFDKMFIIENSENFDEINEKIKYIIDNEKYAQEKLENNVKKIPRKNDAVNCFKKTFEKLINK